MLLEISQNLQKNTWFRAFFFDKVAGLSNFINKETLAQVFSCKFCKISKNIFLQNTSGRLVFKKGYCKAKQTHFINRTITKENCEAVSTKNEFLKHQKWNRKANNKQRSYCVSLIKNGKQIFCGINTTDLTHNKTFSRRVKPFSQKQLRFV